MKKLIKNWWRKSRWRFYLLNIKWNYGFWLGSKKLFKKKTFEIQDNDFHVDDFGNVGYKKEIKTKKRFEGYMYKSMILHDNPGIPKIDRDVWVNWKKKGLI